MKTTIPVMQKGGQAEFGLSSNIDEVATLASKLNIETDTAYVAHVRLRGNETAYVGSIKAVIEQSQTSIGTRRLLLKVELPIAPAGNSQQPNNGCCCKGGTDDQAVPMVSAHVVVTLPAEVAQGIARNEVDAHNRVSAVLRVLQSLLAGATEASYADADSFDGAVLAAGTVSLTSGIGASFKPFATYNPDDGSLITIHEPVDANAPVWGMIGGLKQL